MKNLSKGDISRIIEMAWSDEIPFESIKFQFGILEKEVVKIMRKELKQTSFKMWRKRVSSKVSRKHRAKNNNKK